MTIMESLYTVRWIFPAVQVNGYICKEPGDAVRFYLTYYPAFGHQKQASFE